MRKDDRLPVITPAPLKNDDKIIILSPSGSVKTEFVEDAAGVLSQQGWKVEIASHALGKVDSYSGTVEERLHDMKVALLDPSVKAVFCSRGGYGAVHLLDALDSLPLRDNPKWIIGYSDISALHALMSRHGIVSLHAPMAKHLSLNSGNDDDSKTLFRILRGNMPAYHIASHNLNRNGSAQGKLVGGNLAVIADLIATPYDPFEPGAILFIEDIAEPVYKTERIMYQLKMSGILERLGGLIVGEFTEYTPGVDGKSMEEMIAEMVCDYKYPVAMGVPVGHVDHNLPFPISANVRMTVSPTLTVLDFTSQY